MKQFHFLENGYLPYQPDFEQQQNYQNYIVHKGHPLWGIVSDFYQFDANPVFTSSLCIIPDGCMDLLFKYCDDTCYGYIEGYHTEKLILPVTETGCAFGARFLPGMISTILDIPATKLLSSQILLYDLLSHNDYLDKMTQVYTFSERIDLITSFILCNKEKNCPSSDIVQYCTQKIVASQGTLSLETLAENTGYTLRHIRELFYRYVGISPKEFSEIIQFQQSFYLYFSIKEKKETFSLSDFAIQSGYYDQSHMNKIYRKMTGTLLPELYSQISKTLTL